jgi:hypothetical protein
MVPPWVSDVLPPSDGNKDNPVDNDDHADSASPQADSNQPPIPPAPPGRFGPARTSLGRFAYTGSAEDMRRGIGHYVHKGLGGSRTAVRRFGSTANTAGVLYNALSSIASGQTFSAGSPLDPVLLAGQSVDVVMDAVVEAVRPVDGTLDAEASRDAINNALSELLGRYPDADLLNLSNEQRLFAIEHYIAWDVFNRFRLDVGKTIQDKAPSISMALARLKEARDYIREGIAASFRKIQGNRETLSSCQVKRMVLDVLKDAFIIFEGYLT